MQTFRSTIESMTAPGAHLTMVPTYVQSRLWAVVHEIMRQRGITSHRGMAFAAGVSDKLIDKIAKGHTPKASTLKIMEEALGLGRNELLIAAGYLSEPREISPERMKLLMLIESMSSQAQEEVVEYAKFLILRDRSRKTGPEGGRQDT